MLDDQKLHTVHQLLVDHISLSRRYGKKNKRRGQDDHLSKELVKCMTSDDVRDMVAPGAALHQLATQVLGSKSAGLEASVRKKPLMLPEFTWPRAKAPTIDLYEGACGLLFFQHYSSFFTDFDTTDSGCAATNADELTCMSCHQPCHSVRHASSGSPSSRSAPQPNARSSVTSASGSATSPVSPEKKA